MARRSAALIGPGSGPAVIVRGQSAVLQIRGLTRPEKVVAVLYDLHGEELKRAVVEGNGDFVLEHCFAVSVEYGGKARSFNACIRTGVKNAVDCA